MKNFINEHSETIKLGLLTTLICYFANIVFTILLLGLLLIPIIGSLLSIVAGVFVIFASYLAARYILTKNISIDWTKGIIVAAVVYVVGNLIASILYPINNLIWLLAPVFYVFVVEK